MSSRGELPPKGRPRMTTSKKKTKNATAVPDHQGACCQTKRQGRAAKGPAGPQGCQRDQPRYSPARWK
jgi:hypothetical protein